MSKHSPGPWYLLEGEHNGRWVVKSLPDDLHKTGLIISLVPVGPDTIQSGPNARLIAAAPELLNAVRFVLEYHGDKQNEQTLEVLRKAITKAEGEEK